MPAAHINEVRLGEVPKRPVGQRPPPTVFPPLAAIKKPAFAGVLLGQEASNQLVLGGEGNLRDFKRQSTAGRHIVLARVATQRVCSAHCTTRHLPGVEYSIWHTPVGRVEYLRTYAWTPTSDRGDAPHRYGAPSSASTDGKVRD
jgi:hypothetical protein